MANPIILGAALGARYVKLACPRCAYVHLAKRDTPSAGAPCPRCGATLQRARDAR